MHGEPSGGRAAVLAASATSVMSPVTSVALRACKASTEPVGAHCRRDCEEDIPRGVVSAKTGSNKRAKLSRPLHLGTDVFTLLYTDALHVIVACADCTDPLHMMTWCMCRAALDCVGVGRNSPDA